jgi:hypothetical protein
MIRALVRVAVLAMALPVSAQLVVSPASLATIEGNSNNTYPFNNNMFRYQQVHGDLRGTPFLMKGIHIRGDGMYASPARTVDLELIVSNGPYVGFSQVFDANHGQIRFVTFTRKFVNLPALAVPPAPPAPFTVIFPFDMLYPHTGNFDVVWEARIHGNTTSASYIMDAHSHSPADVTSRTSTPFGTGCTASGRSLAVAAGSQFHAYAAAAQFAAMFWSANGPASLPSTMLLGTSALDVPVPGLCSNLYVAPLITVAAVTTADGLHAVGPLVLPYDPALVGLTLMHQTAGIDPTRSDAIKVAVSNRATNSVPAPPAGGAAPIRRLWLLGNATGPVGSMDGNYGVVIGFDR